MKISIFKIDFYSSLFCVFCVFIQCLYKITQIRTLYHFENDHQRNKNITAFYTTRIVNTTRQLSCKYVLVFHTNSFRLSTNEQTCANNVHSDLNTFPLMDSNGVAISCLVLNSTTGNTRCLFFHRPKRGEQRDSSHGISRKSITTSPTN